ncbi:hypothetical protein L6164_034922 [Bauhinia variegata]|uniref:Uncharacterized protein n=1 Tax=Bauhinia variegata TaxID=167791 RepID=A0ACB9KW25_BAUVA|nr:hypothetical protein L6164_034922 [Bauhinia variegata]
MDDSCVVCADTLEWVAYGPCSHREVCSTCVVRLRFICGDCHCCLCKSESNVVFVTKALGDHTKLINDFSVFPVNPTEGRVGSYWYHEGTQAYFDDLDHYKMIKDMCRLSCGVCDKINEQKIEGTKRTAEFKNIEQLKSHLHHRHRLFMCNLCLEGRKIFVSEQKVYTKTQLDQHIKTGNSVIDGNECERGGFMGHPMCEFCQNPFYGDNELYSHMSTEHYTCHICQRRHTGQYEYYKDYDDLENHFREKHFLCENEECLAKKFVVFATESDFKRHNAGEHKGCIYLSRHNVVHQIPISLRYRQSTTNDGRGSEHNHDSLGNQRFWANLSIVNEENINNTSSSARRFNKVKSTVTESSANSFDVLATLQSEPSLRSNLAAGQNYRNRLLEESSFPPLPSASRSNRPESKSRLEEIGETTTVSRHHHRQNNKNVTNFSSRAQPITSIQPISSTSSSLQPSSVGDSPCSSLSKSATVTESSFPVNRGSLKNSISKSKISPISVNGSDEVQSSSLPVLKMEDVQTANKLLVEKIRTALHFDDNKLAAFREASAGYRRGSLNAEEFLAKVHEFGLSHLTLELARLCPDAQKQKQLIETYNLNMRIKPKDNNLGSDSGQPKKSSSRKGKEKCVDEGSLALADNSISCLNNVQYKSKSSEKELKSLSCAKGKSKVSGDDDRMDKSPCSRQAGTEQMSKMVSLSGGGCLKKDQVTEGAGNGNKQRKKIPKFPRNRLVNDVTAISDLDDSDPGPTHCLEQTPDRNQDPPRPVPLLGVWQNGGGKRIVAKTQIKLIK